MDILQEEYGLLYTDNIEADIHTSACVYARYVRMCVRVAQLNDDVKLH